MYANILFPDVGCLSDADWTIVLVSGCGGILWAAVTYNCLIRQYLEATYTVGIGSDDHIQKSSSLQSSATPVPWVSLFTKPAFWYVPGNIYIFGVYMDIFCIQSFCSRNLYFLTKFFWFSRSNMGSTTSIVYCCHWTWPTCSFCLFNFRALLVANYCQNNAFYILLSWMPTFFHENFPDAKVLHVLLMIIDNRKC